MLRKLCAGVAFLAVVACGGGGGGGDGDGDGDGTKGAPAAATPTVTVGSTVVAVGETKTIHAAVGDTLSVATSEPFTGFNRLHVEGKTCTLQFPGGIHTGVSAIDLKLVAGTDECVLEFVFDAGKATLDVVVP